MGEKRSYTLERLRKYLENEKEMEEVKLREKIGQVKTQVKTQVKPQKAMAGRKKRRCLTLFSFILPFLGAYKMSIAIVASWKKFGIIVAGFPLLIHDLIHARER